MLPTTLPIPREKPQPLRGIKCIIRGLCLVISIVFLALAAMVSNFFPEVGHLRAKHLQKYFTWIKGDNNSVMAENFAGLAISSIAHLVVWGLVFSGMKWVKVWARQWNAKFLRFLKAMFLWLFNLAAAYAALKLKGAIWVCYLAFSGASVVFSMAFLVISQDTGFLDCVVAVALSGHVRLPEHYLPVSILIAFITPLREIISLFEKEKKKPEEEKKKTEEDKKKTEDKKKKRN